MNNESKIMIQQDLPMMGCEWNGSLDRDSFSISRQTEIRNSPCRGVELYIRNSPCRGVELYIRNSPCRGVKISETVLVEG